MPGFIGLPELMLLAVLALVLFGPKRLPEMGRSLGKGVVEFKKGLAGIEDDAAKPALPSGDAQKPALTAGGQTVAASGSAKTSEEELRETREQLRQLREELRATRDEIANSLQKPPTHAG